jgi:hypothetical protein
MKEQQHIPSDSSFEPKAPSLKSILMIEPTSFGFNDQTSSNNYFQQNMLIEQAQEKALAEFNTFVEKLKSNGIKICIIKDTINPQTPDAVFPNNWISFHEEGKLVLYPMFAPNRRAERKQSVIDEVGKIFDINETIDLTYFEEKNVFLEGTGSMVLDRMHKIAYACQSDRTDKEVMDVFCLKMGYERKLFHAVDGGGNLIYHTNVLMCVADRFAVVCLKAIKDFDEQEMLINSLEESGKEIIEISLDQMNHFCGNMLQVSNSAGELFLVMSTQAYENLTADQIQTIQFYNKIIHSPLETIETIGGGSARCMIAEVY